MNSWPFVIAAYTLTLVGTLGLAWASYKAMHRSEAEAAALKDET